MKNLLTGLLAVIASNILLAQTQATEVQTPCTTAQQGTAGDAVICYTIGEMVLVDSWQKNGLFITQGIMQPITKGIADASVYDCFSQSEVKIYPNPNPGQFTLQISVLKKGSFKTLLYDGTGRLVQTDAFGYTSFTSRPYNISRFSAGMYYLQLFFTEEGQTTVKKCAYSIQKSN